MLKLFLVENPQKGRSALRLMPRDGRLHHEARLRRTHIADLGDGHKRTKPCPRDASTNIATVLENYLCNTGRQVL